MHTYDHVFADKQNILVVTAHPDDSVVFFGALMHRLCTEGKQVYVLVVTNGARGSRQDTISESELAAKRLQEETNALGKLGVPKDHVFCLGYADGEVESTLPFIGQIAKYIRQFSIDLVCTHDPAAQYVQTYDKSGYFVQHRDHRKVGEATIDAVYPFSRDRSFFVDQYVDGIEPHSVYDILLTDETGSNLELDYTDNVSIKKAAMLEHTSQFDEQKVTDIVSFEKVDDRYTEKYKYVNLQW